jgi:hypothetical protein
MEIKDGWSVAHAAAGRMVLPYGFNGRNWATQDGVTVREVVIRSGLTWENPIIRCMR